MAGIMLLALSAMGTDVCAATQTAAPPLRAAFITNLASLSCKNAAAQPDGFAVAIMNTIAKKCGIDIAWIAAATWDEAEALLVAGKVDLIPGIPIRADHPPAYAYTNSFLIQSRACFVRQSAKTIRRVDDLPQSGAVCFLEAADVLTQQTYPQTPHAQSVDNVDTAIMRVLSREDIAVVGSSPIIRKRLRDLGIAMALKKIYEHPHTIERAIMIRTELAEAWIPRINQALDDMRTDGTSKRLYQSFFPTQHSGKYGTLLLLLALIIILPLIFGAMRHYFHATLKKNKHSITLLPAIHAGHLIGNLVEEACIVFSFTPQGESGIFKAQPANKSMQAFLGSSCPSDFEELFLKRWPQSTTVIMNMIRERTSICTDIVLPDGLHEATVFLFPAPSHEKSMAGFILLAPHKNGQESHQHLFPHAPWYASIYEKMDISVLITDAEGTIREMNHMAECLTGTPLAEARGKSLWDIIQLRNRDTFSPIPNPLPSMSIRTEVNLPLNTALIDHHRISHAITGKVIQLDKQQTEETFFAWIIRDVDEQLQHEEQLVQTQKMKSIAQLAGGIANEFNNLLAGIMGYAEMIKDKSGHESPTRKYASQIIHVSEKATDLTSQLLSFSQKGHFLRNIFDIHEVIADVMNILRNSCPSTIHMDQHLRAHLSQIMGDRMQLQHALLHLAVNAREAMSKGGGQFNITTDVVSMTSADCQRSPFDIMPGEFIRLRVCDTGQGMNSHTKHRLFEPFFTTKNPSENAGLGLAAVYGCIVAHHGSITVESLQDKGTEFEIMLPLSQSPLIERRNTDTLPKATQEKRTVLLVDDDAMTRDVAGTFLADLGYTILSADSAEMALAYCREQGEKIDVVILDVIMPQMDGVEAFPLIRNAAPDAAIVMASGFSQHDRVQRLQEMGAVGFVTKPYRKTQLAEILETVCQKK